MLGIDKRETGRRWSRGLLGKVNFMPRRYYERDEDWQVTCPVYLGEGTRGKGVSRKRCPKCDRAGKLDDSKGRLGAHDCIT